ncbi:MAG: potassium transporter TrkG [Lentilitoribacter sp.]
MTGIVHVIALAIAGLSSVLLFPILVGYGEGNPELATTMLIFGTLGVFVSMTVLAAIADQNYTLSRSFSFLSLIILWLVTPLFATFSFMIFANMHFSAAWFEAVSALTTSGASQLPLEITPQSLLVWRACVEWFGGFLTLVSILHVLAPGEFGGLLNTERQLKPRSATKTWLPNSGSYQRLISEYIFITLIIACALMITGVDGLNSIMLSMVSLATGGFVPFEGDLDQTVGRFGQLVIIFGLFIGTVNIFWRRSIIRSPRAFFRKNVELNYILLGLGFLSLIYALRFATLAGGQTTLGKMIDYFVEGLFSATSLVATSGMQTREGAIAVMPNILVLIIIIIGASIYSTTGGIKIYRLSMMARHALRELSKLIHPGSVKNLRFGDVVIDEQKMGAIWSHFILSLIVIGAGAFIISIFGYSFEAAITLAISLFSNAAPVYDALTPPLVDLTGDQLSWPPLDASENYSYILFSMLMLIGRLEVIVVFAVLNIRYWIDR